MVRRCGLCYDLFCKRGTGAVHKSFANHTQDQSYHSAVTGRFQIIVATKLCNIFPNDETNCIPKIKRKDSVKLKFLNKKICRNHFIVIYKFRNSEISFLIIKLLGIYPLS
jgi:hypothetical protein